MPPTINRPHLRTAAADNPHATYAELARITGYHETSVARILRDEFGQERNPRFVVVADFDDFRQGATFAQQDFMTSAWGGDVWPVGLRLRDGSGEVFEVRGWLRKRTWRQRLVGAVMCIEPVDCNGRGRRVAR